MNSANFSILEYFNIFQAIRQVYLPFIKISMQIFTVYEYIFGEYIETTINSVVCFKKDEEKMYRLGPCKMHNYMTCPGMSAHSA